MLPSVNKISGTARRTKSHLVRRSSRLPAECSLCHHHAIGGDAAARSQQRRAGPISSATPAHSPFLSRCRRRQVSFASRRPRHSPRRPTALAPCLRGLSPRCVPHSQNSLALWPTRWGGGCILPAGATRSLPLRSPVRSTGAQPVPQPLSIHPLLTLRSPDGTQGSSSPCGLNPCCLRSSFQRRWNTIPS